MVRKNSLNSMMNIIIFCFPVFLLAQQKITLSTIDSKLEKSNALLIDGKTDDMIKLNLLVLKESKQINYAKGRLFAYYNLALAHSMQYKYNKSNYYLKLMEPEFKYMDNEDQKVAMNIVHSMNYRGIKMYDEAIKKLKSNLIPADNIKKDSVRYSLKGILFTQIVRNYLEKKNYDSATYYGKRAVEELKKSKKMDPALNTNLKIVALLLSETKLSQNKIDSAEFYIKSAQSVPIQLGNHEFTTLKLLGQIHEARKEYDAAILDYSKAIELATKIKNLKKMLELYGLISEVYEKTGQADNQKKYSLKYIALNDSINTIEANNLKDTVGLFVKDKQKPLEDKSNYLFYIILIGITSAAVAGYFINKKIRKKNTVLNVKDEENQKLNQKLNLAFEEVVQLAKSNSPEFTTRFQEVYPDFFKNLLKIEPQLLNTDLKFCALLFLNFSTKDIASYTFVQPQSIQIKKNRLRKKLNIPSDEDIYIWMKNINKA